jgi:Histidine kinase-, DNA gyrase B-, and HSP90-like ATPase
VGDLIHLLAELVDNATAFSPPDALVAVHGNVVGKGVAVEVEDQGLGIALERRERLNETLRHPPGFQAMALSGQRHLGLFVVGQLAQRHSIAVTLLESAYGGIRAIVLVPFSVIEADGAVGDGSSAPGRSGRHEQRQAVLAAAAADPPPWPGHSEDADLRARSAAESPADSVPPSLPRPGARARVAPWDTAPGPAPNLANRSRAPLPRRERLANLVPGLHPGADAGDSMGPRQLRSPEEARGSMSALQRGTRQGRSSSHQDNR